MISPYASEKSIFQNITWKLQFIKLYLPTHAFFAFEFGVTTKQASKRGPRETDDKARGCNRGLALRQESQRLLYSRNVFL